MGNFFTSFLIKTAYKIASSKRYAASKSFFRNLLLNDSYRYKKYFDYAMIFLVLLTVGIYIYDIRGEINIWLWAIEMASVAVFLTEYLLRFWVYSDVHKIVIARYEEWDELIVEPRWSALLWEITKNKLLFMFHPMSIIDFLSIHPELRPLRLFKIFRYSEITRGLLEILSAKKYEFGVLFVLISMTVFIASSLFYVFEAENDKVNTYFDAVYWAVITIATVGYGDVVPTTVGSKIASIFLVFAGLGVLAMLTSLVTASLGQKINAVREQKNHEHIENLKDYVLVCGFGKLGEELCHKLYRANVSFVAMDMDKTRVDRAKSLGFKAFLADASKLETLKSLDIGKKAKAVIAATKNDIANISITLAARSISQDIKIIAKANESRNEQKILFAGADEIVGLKQGAYALAEFVNSPVAFQAIHGFLVDEKHIAVEELLIGRRGDKEITLASLEPKKFGCLIAALKKEGGGYLFNPKEETLLHSGDKLIVIGRPKRVEGLKLKIARELNA